MFGSLDAMAPLISICFLIAYAALNASCFVLDLSKPPSWRPKWKFFHWILAAAGCLLCIILSFVIKWYWALACLVEVDWGSGLGGLQLHLAVHSIIKLSREAHYTVNWKPQLLLLLKPWSAMGPDDQSNEELVLLGSQLKKGQGLCVIATILEGTMQRMAAQRVAEKLELENKIEKLNVLGFVRVFVAPTYRQGKSFVIQSSGLGALEPNTDWHEEGHYHNADDNQSSTAKNARLSEQQDEINTMQLMRSSKQKLTRSAEIGRKAEHILRKTVPGELSMLEGKEYQPRGRGSLQEITMEDTTDGKNENVKQVSGLHVMIHNDHDEGGMVSNDNIEDNVVRKDIAGQVYPGSPHTSDYGAGDSTIDIPEVVKRTWKTFSQDYLPDELNKRILERSKDAQLVLLNLPDHYKGMEPAQYMEYFEKLTKGLRRVLLVSGTGKELWRGE